MIKAILLDLDNTLLSNPDIDFARGFLNSLEEYFQNMLDVEGASEGFRQGLRGFSRGGEDAIRRNTDWLVTILTEILGCEQESVRDTLTGFYRDVYPSLQGYVQPIAGAAELIEQLHQAGYKLVIATNPIYSHEATLARMNWAELPIATGLYSLITSADNMHFSKAHPAYYAEIVARVGIEPDEALMVGDSAKNDILSAKQAGLYAYHVSDGDLHEACDAGGGSLSSFSTFIETGQLETLAQTTLKTHHIMPEYLGNLGAMYGLLAGVKANYWHQRPKVDEWSIVQILCHLWQSELEHERPRLERILLEDNPFIAAPAPPGPDLAVCAEDGWMIARLFEAERRKTLHFLAGLKREDWERPARHSVFGHTYLLEMAHFTAQHDRLHLNQLCQTIGYCE